MRKKKNRFFVYLPFNTISKCLVLLPILFDTTASYSPKSSLDCTGIVTIALYPNELMVWLKTGSLTSKSV